MSELQKVQVKLKTQRKRVQEVKDQIYGRKQSINILQQRIQERIRLAGNTGRPEDDKDWNTILQLSAEIAKWKKLLPDREAQVRAVEQELDRLGEAPGLIAQHWKADMPTLLLPLRVQTRFVRVKHITRVKKEYIFDSSRLDHQTPGFGAGPISGISADEQPWTGKELKEIITLDKLKAEGNDNSNFVRAIEREIKDNRSGVWGVSVPNEDGRQWIKQQPDQYELLVRIYPDEIALHSHEANMMLEEVRAGQAFWHACWQAELAHPGDPAARKEKKSTAWKVLQEKYLPARAAYIYHETKPKNYPPDPKADPVPKPDFSNFRQGVKTDDWTRPMASYIMPDRFAVHLYGHNDQPSFMVPGSRITYPLPLSHDPLTDDTQNDQIPEEIRWITDFEAAEKEGLAVRIKLSRETYQQGFSKLVVLGVNLSMDETMGKEALETLFTNHQYKEGGLGILPQGTATNNFERERSGYTFKGPPAEEVFQAIDEGIALELDRFWTEKKDGHYLAHLLGVDAELFSRVYQADMQDIAGALAMNHLLWPATGGYFLEQFFQPLLSPNEIRETGTFFRSFVSGRGFLPAFHIGNQPYGILAGTAYSRLTFSAEEKSLSDLYHRVLSRLDAYWEQLVPYIRHIDNLTDVEGEQVHKFKASFVEMIGLNASSENFFHRPVVGEFLLWNLFRGHREPSHGADVVVGGAYLDQWELGPLTGNPGRQSYIFPEVQRHFEQLFGTFGSQQALDKNRIFNQHRPPEYQLLTGPIVDPLPPAFTRNLSLLPDSDLNYLQFLYGQKAADMPALFGSDGSDRSNTLLYLLARQGLGRAYVETAVKMASGNLISTLDFELEHLWDDNTLRKEQIEWLKGFDAKFEDQLASAQSTHAPFYKSNKWNFLSPEIGTSIDEQLDQLLSGGLSEAVLEDSVVKDLVLSKASLQLLSGLSTTSLELLFTEHLDLCNYRLDAWMQGIVNRRLFALREQRPTGIYVGAYGYLEDVKPRLDNAGTIFKVAEELETDIYRGGSIFGLGSQAERVVIPVLDFASFTKAGMNLDQAIAEAWLYLGEDPRFNMQYDPAQAGKIIAIQTDEGYNQGFIHTPSQAHAVTAAILRSGFMANNPAKLHDAFAVNLSSNSVRSALHLIEGVKNGQGLPELLGYQFERYLHDNASGPLDQYIRTLRRHFPLNADQLPNYDYSQPIEKQEASNVVDGWRLVKKYRHIRKVNDDVVDKIRSAWSDYGIGGEDEHWEGLFAAMEKVSQDLDHVSDLLLSESVFQVAKGNLQGAATALKMFNNDIELDKPEIVDTPRRHKLLSHILGIQFDTKSSGTAWSGRMTPRAQINPQLNHWLADQLPRPHTICINILLSDGKTRKKLKVSELAWQPLSELPTAQPAVELQPIDFLALFAGKEAFTENSLLSWYIRMTAKHKFEDDRPEAIRILYDDLQGLTRTQCSIYEIYPLIQTIQQLLEQSRPMLPSDLQREADTNLAEAAAIAAIDNSRLMKTLEELVNGKTFNSLQRRIDHANNFAYRLRRARGTDLSPDEAQLSYNNLQDILFLDELWNHTGNFYHLGPTYSDSRREVLLAQAVESKAYFSDLKEKAGKELGTIKGLTDQEEQWEALQKLVKRIFGEAFFIFPEFDLPQPASFSAAREFPDLLADAGPFAPEEWLQGLAQVRKPVKTYRQLHQLKALLEIGTAEPSLDIIQLPFVMEAERYRWLGAAFPEGTAIPGDPLSLALELPDNYRPTDRQCGMVIDFWREALPEDSTTSGIAMHYDQPNSEPPQTLLLCVSPKATTEAFWNWEDLILTITDTMELAKKRAVDPDLLVHKEAEGPITGVLKYILPGVLAPVCYNGATPWTDFGVNNINETQQS